MTIVRRRRWRWRWAAGGARARCSSAGLWWTVRRGLASTRPALWLLGSALLRTRRRPGRLLRRVRRALGAAARLGLLGFVMARALVTRLLRPRAAGAGAPPPQGAPPCALAPTRRSSGSTGAQAQRHHRLHLGLMAVLAVGSKLITRRLSTGLDALALAERARDRGGAGSRSRSGRSGCANPQKYLGFLGTLFLFIATGQPVHRHSRLRAAHGLALHHRRRWRCACSWRCRSSASRTSGLRGYLASYVEPTVIMLPFNIISELSRTLALAVRLFGNMMSGAMILGILLTITPFIFPIVMIALGLLTGMVQAYIFSILAAVYIAAATRVRTARGRPGAHDLNRTPTRGDIMDSSTTHRRGIDRHRRTHHRLRDAWARPWPKGARWPRR